MDIETAGERFWRDNRQDSRRADRPPRRPSRRPARGFGHDRLDRHGRLDGHGRLVLRGRLILRSRLVGRGRLDEGLFSSNGGPRGTKKKRKCFVEGNPLAPPISMLRSTTEDTRFPQH